MWCFSIGTTNCPLNGRGYSNRKWYTAYLKAANAIILGVYTSRSFCRLQYLFFEIGRFVVATFLLTSASHDPSAIAKLLVYFWVGLHVASENFTWGRTHHRSNTLNFDVLLWPWNAAKLTITPNRSFLSISSTRSNGRSLFLLRSQSLLFLCLSLYISLLILHCYHPFTFFTQNAPMSHPCRRDKNHNFRR